LSKKVITQHEADTLLAAEKLRWAAINVDSFKVGEL
jgi:hypothetical protein